LFVAFLLLLNAEYIELNIKASTIGVAYEGRTSCKHNSIPFICLYTVSQKNIPDISGCNLKTNYQILTIFGTHISDTT